MTPLHLPAEGLASPTGERVHQNGLGSTFGGGKRQQIYLGGGGSGTSPMIMYEIAWISPSPSVLHLTSNPSRLDGFVY